ncbi:MAG: pilus assembly protein, partial [Anaerolineae bacterium]
EDEVRANYQISHKVSGNYVTVTVTYNQPVYVPGLMMLLGGSRLNDRLPLSSSATFKIESRGQ